MNQQNLFKEYENIFEEEMLEVKRAGKFEFAYNPFALQDAIGERSAKKAWIEYQKLRISGVEADELVFKIASKIKDILSIIKGVSKEDLGIIKDLPFNKSKKAAKNWQEKSLADLYTRLITAYHEARMGKKELDAALEEIILSI